MSEAAVGPVALGAAQAEAALAQTGDILGGDGVIGQQAGQQQVKNGALGVHHTAGQTADRHTVQIAHEEHGTRQHRCAVGDDVRAGVPDGQRGAVVRVHAHAAGGKDQLTACGLCFQNGGRDARRVIVADLVEGHLTAIHRQLLLEDGSKLVLNAALEHLAAGGDNGKLLLVEGQHVQDGLRPGSSLHGLHLLLLNDQRDDAGTSQLGSLFHRQIAVDRGDHHLGGAVHCQQGPAVDLEQTVAVGDQFGLPRGENVMGKLVNVLHRLGFDEVYDTSYGADLTVIEESEELLERLASGENLPLFTSCCPAWVKFCENRYPDLAKNLSTCRSPQQMFGAVIREYYKDPEKNGGKRIVSVSIMPCTAKKEEILRPESSTNGKQDIDYVLTTTELITMIRKSGIRFENLEIEASDMPFGIGSGAGVIFGVTGGVTEAVLRRLREGHNRVEMDKIKFSGVRGEEGLKEVEFDYNGRTTHAAVVSGLGNADALMKKIQKGEVHYDFVEVMACRRGCIMGGGQPVPAGPRSRIARSKGLYDTDINTQIKKSNENPLILSLYDELLKGKTHELLHRNFEAAKK